MRQIFENPLVTLSSILALGILAQWVAWRLRIPSILLLLTSGFVLRYAGGFNPDLLLGREILFPIVSLGVAMIMFEGGLTLSLRDIQTSRGVVVRLVSVGALATMGLVTCFAWWMFSLDLPVAAMIGALLVVSGPTVVMPLLRHVRPSRRIAAVIKWEGIVIDPVGALLAYLVFTLLFSNTIGDGTSWTAQAILVGRLLLKTCAIAGIMALPAVWLFIAAIRNYWIPDFLHSAAALAIAVATFTASNVLQPESGLVTVTLLGILLANQRKVELHHVVQFKENLGVLVISCLFIVLAARIDIAQIIGLGFNGLWFLSLLVFVVRPIAVWLSTIRSELNYRERILLAFLAPRGIVAAAVASVFAMHISNLPSTTSARAPHSDPVQHLAEENADPRLASGTRTGSADQIVAVTFLVIVGSVIVYGLIAAPLASLLRLSERNAQGLLIAGASDWVRELAHVLQKEHILVHLIDTNYQNISIARQDGIPGTCASILSEYVLEELELSGIGRFLALTANDDLNRLATIALARHLERSNVFQLVPWQIGGRSSRHDAATSIAQGRLLFRADASFGELTMRHARGDTVRRTKLTEEFTFDDFRQQHGEDVIVLMVKRGQELLIPSVDRHLAPRPMDTVIALIPADDQRAGETNRSPAT